MTALCLLAVNFTTALPQSSSAQDVADPRQWIESVLSILVNVGEDAAIQRIENESFIGKNNAAGFVKIKVLVSGQAKIAGPATGFEFISMENWGNSLKRYIYLVKRARQPVVWLFSFYKPEDAWRLVSFRFEGQVHKIPWPIPLQSGGIKAR